MSINLLVLIATVAVGQESGPPPVCPSCPPPESELLPMVIVASIMFGGGWLIRMLWDKRKRK